MTEGQQKAVIDIWLVQPDELISASAITDPVLSPDEQRRSRTILDPARGVSIARRRIVLRSVLGFLLGLPGQSLNFTNNPDGKPLLAGHSLKFNLSASENWIAIATCETADVGIDIECHRQIAEAERIAARFFHPSEAVDFRNLPDDHRSRAFLECWTRKEALLKADGRGMRGGLDSTAVGFQPLPRNGSDILFHGISYRLFDVTARPDTAVSLAVRSTAVEIRLRHETPWHSPL